MSIRKPPDLIQLYIKSCLLGFVAAGVFVAMLLGFNIMGLGGLIFRSDVTVLVIVIMWIANGLVFAGVQFGIAIMSMAEYDDDDDDHGKPSRVFVAEPAPVPVASNARR